MADRISPEKQAMDEKLAKVWAKRKTESAVGQDSSVSSGFKVSKERLDALKPAQEEAVNRVFRPLGVV